MTEYYYSDTISYNPDIVSNAMRALKEIQLYEDTADYAKLKNDLTINCTSKRYFMHKHNNLIDSTYYTDVATTTLAYNIWIFYNKFNDSFDNDIISDVNNYFIYGSHDLSNDSFSFFGGATGDMDLFESDLFIGDALYAYYNEYEIIDNENRYEDLMNRIDADVDDEYVIFRKVEYINGERMEFYYVGVNFYDISSQMLHHEYNSNFLAERFDGEILDAISDHYPIGDEIIIVSNECRRDIEEENSTTAAYAAFPEGYIVVYNDCFTETICHEFGHLFDDLNMVDLILGLTYSPDYNNGNFGKWDKLTEEYAEAIYSIRIGADIGCGYSVEGMYDKHYEFYAEAFQLYFYSPETRAALPEVVRERIEWELEEYAYNRD